MITGITHLTMEGERARGIDLTSDLGFTPSVVDDVVLPAGFEGIEDGAAEDGAEVLPLALLVGPQGVRLEVVQHRRQTGRRGAYGGIFGSPPPATAGPVVSRPDVGSLLRRAGILDDPVCVAMETPRDETWFGSSSSTGGLVGVLCHAADVPAEAAFWAAFARARWHEIGVRAAWGRAPLPLPQGTCALVVVRDEAPPSPFAMNDSGFPSLGVYSTSIERDCGKALAAGATQRADPIVTSVGGRSLRMALISTPGGAPVELLGVYRGVKN